MPIKETRLGCGREPGDFDGGELAMVAELVFILCLKPNYVQLSHAALIKERNENLVSNSYLYTNSHSIIIYGNFKLETTQCPLVNEWIRNCDMVCTFDAKFCSAIKNSWTVAIDPNNNLNVLLSASLERLHTVWLG